MSPKDGASCGLEEEGEEGGPPAVRQERLAGSGMDGGWEGDKGMAFVPW